MKKVIVTGGAGFIGSNLVDRLLKIGCGVKVIDNFSGGDRSFIAPHMNNPNFELVELDVRDTNKLTEVFSADTEIVFHLAANADISRGVEDPTLDFEHTLVATFSVLQAMKARGIKKLCYTSGSGVYGDCGQHYSSESDGPLLPVSMYGAAKLGAESLISGFVHLYEMQAWIMRPANIIGQRSTHGVIYDFLTRLLRDPTHLRILGDGKQSKSYLYVEDVIDSLLYVIDQADEPVNIFNLSTTTFVTVNEIASEVVSALGLKSVKLDHTDGSIGWKGDVAIVRLNNSKLARLGWQPKYDSRQAVQMTIGSLINDPRFHHD